MMKKIIAFSTLFSLLIAITLMVKSFITLSRELDGYDDFDDEF